MFSVFCIYSTHIVTFCWFFCVELLSLVECGHWAYKICDFIILFVQISEYSNPNKK